MASNFFHRAISGLPTDRRSFGMRLRLRQIRKARGITVDEAAAAAGVTEASISRIERGEQNTTLETLQSLASLYNVDVPELFAYEGTNPLMRLAWSVDPADAELVADILEAYLRRAAASERA